MNKEKAREKLFERVNIADPEYAQKLYDKEKIKLKIKLVCIIIAAMGSICGYIYVFGEQIDKNTFWHSVCGVMWMLGLLSTLVAGSFFNIFKVIFKVGQFGYNLIPFFLLNLLGFVFGLAFGIIVAITLPVIPCAMTLYQSWQNMNDAEDYLESDNITGTRQTVYTTTDGNENE